MLKTVLYLGLVASVSGIPVDAPASEGVSAPKQTTNSAGWPRFPRVTQTEQPVEPEAAVDVVSFENSVREVPPRFPRVMSADATVAGTTGQPNVVVIDEDSVEFVAPWQVREQRPAPHSQPVAAVVGLHKAPVVQNTTVAEQAPFFDAEGAEQRLLTLTALAQPYEEMPAPPAPQQLNSFVPTPDACGFSHAHAASTCDLCDCQGGGKSGKCKGCECYGGLGCTTWKGKCSLFSTCDMYPHFPYPPMFHGYYYFRPYNYDNILRQQQVVSMWGGNPQQPYSIKMFDQYDQSFQPSFEPPQDEVLTPSVRPRQDRLPLLEDLLRE